MIMILPKLFHQIIYYIILVAVIVPAMIVVALLHNDVRTFDRFYFKCNCILNQLKGEYDDIGR
jgi:hypothetical protein